jgi:2',3'-cyclic-nucleotide 2'-phosphodiesterase
MNIKVLLLGDIVGKAGKAGIRKRVRFLKEELGLSFVIANGENSSGGVGIDHESMKELLSAGIDFVTLGDHAFNKLRNSQDFFTDFSACCIRPANVSDRLQGAGFKIIKHKSGLLIGVVNILGRVFMSIPVDCPFKTMEKLIRNDLKECDIIICDFHAEATSEKVAFSRYFDGQISLCFGTHTHVQTADAQVLPLGSAYITDIGMCGPAESVIGMDIEEATKRLITGYSSGYKPGKGDALLSGAIWEYSISEKKTITLVGYQERVKI